MCRDSQPRLGFDILLAQIYVLLRARVHNFNVHALVLARPDVRCNDHESVGVYGIPYTFWRRVPHGLQSEFDSMALKRCKDENERKNEE